MTNREKTIRTVQILLTITAFECFGPIVRDFNVSHAWNPDWDGHARFHLVWQLATMGLSGIANLYLIWFRKPLEVRTLWLSAAWQGTILAGFWVACLLTPVYEGRVTMPNIHMYIFGIDENVVVFTLLSAVLAAAVTLLATRLRDTTAR
jgi:hypothetical protein